MAAAKVKPKTIRAYIDAAPRPVQKKLRALQACLHAVAPDATESIKWGMPAFCARRILFTFAVFKEHIGFYPTPEAVAAFAKDLTKFKTSRGAIQFPLDKPLPLLLIRKIAAFRLKQSKESDAKVDVSYAFEP